ncbi:MAG: c-type cytochrome, partial [Planctomycetota bacterium]|nr:c-type cytochrome [Planctomycetota bacterium]
MIPSSTTPFSASTPARSPWTIWIRLRAGAALLPLLALWACNDSSNWSPEIYGLSEESHLSLQEASVAAEEVRIVEQLLAELFGTPRSPAYRHLDDPAMAADLTGGLAALDQEGRMLLLEENELRFEGLLEFVDAGELKAMVISPSYPELWRRWEVFMAETGGVDTQENIDRAEALILEDYPTLAQSARKFQALCLHCHGISGAGDGPTSEFLNPRPRNYHFGVFKRISVERNTRPLRSDLRKILLQGIHGTAMPSFARLSRAGLEGLVDYVRFLSLRGETERMLVASLLVGESLDLAQAAELRSLAWSRWNTAPERVVRSASPEPPPVSADSLARGRELFLDPEGGNCASCHGDTGCGDGASAFELDEDGELAPALRDEWGRTILARDLTEDLFRFGGEPLDVYRRIRTGISGGPMPGIGPGIGPGTGPGVELGMDQGAE